MGRLRAILDNEIRIPREDVDEALWEDLSPLLHIPNREKEEARKRRQWGWQDMPDWIAMWYEDDGHIVVPRGMRDPLEQGFRALGREVEWVDNRTRERVMQVWPPFDLRFHQGPAAEAALAAQEGIVEAPAGSGKTVTGLEIVRRARMARNLVIVNEIGIARQWAEEAATFLGGDFPVGIVGGGEWNERRLTIATVQTLYSRIDSLPEEWWSSWGLVILDECHHQTAATFIEVMGRFPSLLRLGLSATPDKTGDFDIAQAVLGDVVVRTTRHELRDHGILMRPTVEVVDTGFQFPYWGDHEATKAHDYVCEKPDCPDSGRRRHGHRNNYAKMLKALVEDPRRNDLIASKILERSGHRQIVVSKQTKHLRAIREAMERAGVASEVIWLTGDVSEDDRIAARQRVISERDCVLLTTIADEAFNAPPLDTIHMPFPTRNNGAIRQRIGRVERAWPGKEDPVAFDYRDPIGVLLSQYKARRWGVYAEERYRVVSARGEEQP